MSRSKPNTLLSFICNTTGVPAYRTEMHMDMRRAFQRFDVGNGTAQGACFDIERAAYDLRRSSSDAAALKAVNGGLYATAQARMAAAPSVLFNELVDEITEMVVNKTDFTGVDREIDPNGHPGTGVSGFGPVSVPSGGTGLTISDNSGTTDPPPLRHLLLDYVYYFFHFQQARAAIMADMSGVERSVAAIATWSEDVPLDKNGKPVVVAALLELGRRMESPEPVPAETIKPLAEQVCQLLATEYKGRGWRKCW